jgi:xanthine dehydrogenase YagS FAD-binding subunit
LPQSAAFIRAVRSPPLAYERLLGSRFIAGGTNLLDLMKYQVEDADHLIDINRIGLQEIQELPEGGLRIGALARNSKMANHPAIRTRYPVLAEALLSGASPQLRNAATAAGNLLQRTRCYYFYDVGFAECNKRRPGSGCATQDGVNRIHAILGASEHCIATNQSDMNVALTALEAVVQTKSAQGGRSIPVGDFLRLPGDKPELDTVLRSDELITSIDLPVSLRDADLTT